MTRRCSLRTTVTYETSEDSIDVVLDLDYTFTPGHPGDWFTAPEPDGIELTGWQIVSTSDDAVPLFFDELDRLAEAALDREFSVACEFATDYDPDYHRDLRNESI